MNESILIEEIKSGSEEAFVTIVDTFKNKIVSLCYSYTNDMAIAEDLSQEVFISFYKGINNFRGDSSLSTYLYRITVNKCLSYKKKSSLREVVTEFISLAKNESSISYEEKDVVRRSINSLPKDAKTPLILYYYIGLSYKEIGEVLGTSERSVEGKIYRAKQKLKSKLEKEGEFKWHQDSMI